MAQELKCPYCQGHQVVAKENSARTLDYVNVGATRHGRLLFQYEAMRCANPECNEIILKASLIPGFYDGMRQNFVREGSAIREWQLLPMSGALPQPDYIPAALREDYEEACQIKDLSPKASATLARRCLQGMIRDFAGIARGRLVDEIAELRKQVDNGAAPKGVEAETVEAIDHVRAIGNIGAHMEKDISVIVDVDPGEAQALIELIEMLFAEWYIARHKREERLRKIQAIASEKKNAKAPAIPEK